MHGMNSGGSSSSGVVDEPTDDSTLASCHFAKLIPGIPHFAAATPSITVAAARSPHSPAPEMYPLRARNDEASPAGRLLDAFVGDVLLRRRVGAAADGYREDFLHSASPFSTEDKKRKREDEATVEALVRWVREVAVSPIEEPSALDAENERLVLEMRRAMFLKLTDVHDPAELPSFNWKKYRVHGEPLTSQKKELKKLPTRRSERVAGKMNLMTSALLTQRKKIGVGDLFQAKVPEWTGSPSKEDSSFYRDDPDSFRWLGTKVWPLGSWSLQSNDPIAGKGRDEFCGCPIRGSPSCIEHHINVSRNKLRHELGHIFFFWGFHLMGEEVSKSWSCEEQMRLYALERLGHALDYRTFWGAAWRHFASKSREELVQYYFNVFLMRRVSFQSKFFPAHIDSDEDEVEIEGEETCAEKRELILFRKGS